MENTRSPGSCRGHVESARILPIRILHLHLPGSLITVVVNELKAAEEQSEAAAIWQGVSVAMAQRILSECEQRTRIKAPLLWSRMIPTIDPRDSLIIGSDCTLHAVREATRAVRRFLEEHGLKEEDLDDWELIAAEASNNAVHHATPAQRSRSVQFLVKVLTDVVELTLIDHTNGFDWPDRVSLPDDESDNGRGLFLISALCDHVEYRKGCRENLLIICKRRQVGVCS